MIAKINANPNKWAKDVYIASKIGTQLDIEGNEINLYDKPNEKSIRMPILQSLEKKQVL